MYTTKFGLISAIALAAVAPTLASSAEAIAATDLNIRSGPGPQFNVVGVIPSGMQTGVDGCLAELSWCKVMYDGVEGWSYSDYLAVGVEEQAVVLTTRPATVDIKTITYENTEKTQSDQNTGAAVGATLGALTAVAVGGPIGGIIAGSILGGAAGSAAVDPTTETVTYVETNPVETVYLDGEVVVGAGLPNVVTTYELPQPDLRYDSINGQTVLVNAETGVIVRVLR